MMQVGQILKNAGYLMCFTIFDYDKNVYLISMLGSKRTKFILVAPTKLKYLIL